MRRQFTRATRQFIALRANFRCEYCLKPDLIANFSFHIEHIISQQHGGSDDLSNLAYACSYCNWKKGPNISTILEDGGSIIPLFNPRTNNWFDHFFIEGASIHHKTDIGRERFGCWSSMLLIEFRNVQNLLRPVYTHNLHFPSNTPYICIQNQTT